MGGAPPQPESLEDVTRQGQERFFPGLTNPSYLVLSRRRRIFEDWLKEFPGANLSVLDLGGRIQPYRRLVAERLGRYVAVDLERAPLIDVVARGEQLPLATYRFDVVFCTQVLQYVPQPQLVITEIYRVLKPNGILLLSVPSAFLHDSDGEYWRFFPASLRMLLSSFSRVEITPEGGSISGLFRTINVCTISFAKPSLLREFLRFTLVPILNLAAIGLEYLSGSKNDQFTVNYSVRAQK
jgi:SAM-dependent methyltransferase